MSLRLRVLLVCWGLFSFALAEVASAQSAAGCIAQMDAQVTGFENFASSTATQASSDIQAAFAAGDAAGAHARSADAQKSIVDRAGRTVREVVRISSVCIRQMRRTRNTGEIATVAAGMQQAVSDIGTAQAAAIGQLEDTTLGAPGSPSPLAQQIADKYTAAMSDRSARFDAAASSFVARAVGIITQHCAQNDDTGAARVAASSQSMLARSAGTAIAGCDQLSSSGARALARYSNTSQLIANLQTVRDTAVSDIQARLSQGSADIAGACETRAIDIEKLVNGEDADSPPGPTVIEGRDTITFTFIVSNTGTVPLTSVSVNDDQLGAINNIIDQGNGDSTLDPGETWTYEETLPASSVGSFVNTANVTGTDPNGGQVSDSDQGHHVVMPPPEDIEVTRLTIAGQDCDTPPGPTLMPGNTEPLQVEITNTGTVDLTNVQLVGPRGPITTTIDQGNGDAVLDAGESWTYVEMVDITAGVHMDQIDVTASPVASGPAVSDSATCHYRDSQIVLGTIRLHNNSDFTATFSISSPDNPNLRLLDPSDGSDLGTQIDVPRQTAGDNSVCSDGERTVHVELGPPGTQMIQLDVSVSDTRSCPSPTVLQGDANCVVLEGTSNGETYIRIRYSRRGSCGSDPGDITCSPRLGLPVNCTD